LYSAKRYLAIQLKFDQVVLSRFRFLIPFFLLITVQSFGQKLSSEAFASVLTFGPSQEQLYTAFGHSAIRVHDPALGIDYLYNYGVFDFDQPHFYLNFARGNNNYMLAVFDYDRFVYSYIYNDRFVHEQVLDLRHEQLQKLFDYLQWKALPENRSYPYDYFYDNCATRIRDVIESALGDELILDESYVQQPMTMRNLTDEYLPFQPWGDLGIDICLGLPMDKVITPREYMFLPDYIEIAMDHAYLKDDSLAGTKPLVSQKNILYAQQSFPTRGFNPTDPLFVFGLVCAVGLLLTFYHFKKNSDSIWFDRLVFGVTGVLGVLLALLWFATDHAAAAYNYNLIWALPSHAIVAFMPGNLLRSRRYYWAATMLVQLLLLISWHWLPQELNIGLIPLVLLLAVRSGFRFVKASPAAQV